MVQNVGLLLLLLLYSCHGKLAWHILSIELLLHRCRCYVGITFTPRHALLHVSIGHARIHSSGWNGTAIARQTHGLLLCFLSWHNIQLQKGKREKTGVRVTKQHTHRKKNENKRRKLSLLRTRKSKTSVLVIAAAISFLCSVLLLLSSECIHDLKVSSSMKSSHAFANNTGASALIIRTSSSDFII